MKITRHYTQEGFDPRTDIQWKKISVVIKGSGDINVCDVPDLEVPASWTQQAADILAHKYLYKGVIPKTTAPKVADVSGKIHASVPVGTVTMSGESSAYQVFHRIVGHWTYTGHTNGYFDTWADAVAFYDEMFYILANQIAAPNSPQWFNTGIWWAYGITGKVKQGGWKKFAGNESHPYAITGNSPYQCPQTSACFILGLENNLLGDDGIMQTIAKEARIFKYGSGSGVNYSKLQAKGTPLQNGGVSSGLMSFLKIFDSNAGAIKSGGTTRRAARMVVVDAEHPEAEDFVTWKAKEEIKVAAMAAASQTTKADDAFTKDVLSTLDSKYEGEAYQTVSGQNANNTLRVSNGFMQSIVDRETMMRQTQGNINAAQEASRRTRLWDKTIDAAWRCGDPGMHFNDTINMWHTIPKVAEQRASNPCSEFMFIDNSSCNLASINLIKFWNAVKFDVEAFAYVCRMLTVTLDLTIEMSSFPTKEVAENTQDYRPLGLGFANLGGLLMAMGLPYDSAEGRDVASLITALMHGIAWETSTDLAANLGAFKDFDMHKDDVANVLKLHRTAVLNMISNDTPEHVGCIDMIAAVRRQWEADRDFKFAPLPVRNAQLTLIAPTGTIGLVMDCATTGIEPDFSLVKHKKLAGGGNMIMVNPLVEQSLRYLKYTELEISDIAKYVAQFGKVDTATPHIKIEHLPVFACANDISPDGHLKMMQAVQPFISGAISKTVNLPTSATREDVAQTYIKAWKMGLKAVALYRDGCKMSQPLTAMVVQAPSAPAQTNVISAKPLFRKGSVTARHKLPSRRNGFTQKATIDQYNVYLRTGEYPDGRLGEVFINMSKTGSTMGHLLDGVALAMSIGLQYGVPLKEYLDAFQNTKSEPSGLVQGSDTVKMCSSPLDYIARELLAAYGHKMDVVPEEIEAAPVVSEPDHVVDIVVEDVLPVRGQLRVMSRPSDLRAKPQYTGDSCPSCGSVTLRKNGSCSVCDTCGNTTGCS